MHMKKRHLLIGATIPVVLGLFAFTQSDKYFELSRNLDIFSSLYKEVNTYYVDDVNPNKMFKTGVDAMLKQLDPYTVYIAADDIEDYRTSATGQYGGIGIQSNKINGKHLLLNLYEGGPAKEVGMKIGDEMVSIDGQPIKELSDSDAGKLMKGQSGTKVKIGVLRQGEESLTFELERKKIEIPNISYQTVLDDSIGYFKLSQFTKDAGADVIVAIENVKKQGATKLIMDLRGNPGGLLDQAIKICNLFIPKGSRVVETRAKTKAASYQYDADKDPMDLDIPITILLDQKSASASEIVSGVLQDYDRGVVIGQNSFGKGLVQNVRDLSFKSKLKVTISKYYIPSGRCIQELDYSRKSADGKATKMADSLRKEFKTQNGRPVYEGKGITPDILVEGEEMSPYIKNLLKSGLVMEYATDYYYSHDSIAEATEFELSAEEYEAFVTWMSGKTFKNETKVEKTIDILKIAAESDVAYKELVTEIEQIGEAVKKEKSKGLVSFESEIKRELEKEIIKRYYLTEGVVASSLSHDPVIDSAIWVLNHPNKYQSTLGY